MTDKFTISFPGEEPICVAGENWADQVAAIKAERASKMQDDAARNNESKTSGEAARPESAATSDGKPRPNDEIDAAARNELQSIVRRIESLEEDKAEIAEDIREVYKEAKGSGFNVAIIRKVIAIRKKPAAERAEEEALIETYLGGLKQLPLPL